MISFVTDCIRLAYLALLKPYSLRDLQLEIHPDLVKSKNPYDLLRENRTNRPLARYASRVFIVSLLVPNLAILAMGLMWPIISPNFSRSGEFRWFEIGLWTLGWAIGLGINRIPPFVRQKLLIALVVLAIVNLVVVTVAWIGIEPLGRSSDSLRELGVYKFAIGPFGLLVYPIAVSKIFGTGSDISTGLAAGMGYTLGLAFGGDTITAGLIGIAFIATSNPLNRSVYVIAGFLALFTISMSFGAAIGFAWLFVYLRLPYWLLEIVVVSVTYVLSRFVGSARLVRWLPPYFDQVSFLPLPFIDHMIADSYRENQTVAQSAINYLVNYTTQASTARRALGIIAHSAIDRCETLDEVQKLDSNLDWISDVRNTEMHPSITEFRRISESVLAAGQQSSVYRQRRLIGIAAQRSRKLQQDLRASGDPSDADRGSAAARWERILIAAEKGLGERSRSEGEIPLAYDAGNPLQPNIIGTALYRGRTELFKEIEKLVLSHSAPTLLLHGKRRMGKTSTLNFLRARLGGELVPIVINLQAAMVSDSLAGVAYGVAQQIFDYTYDYLRVILPRPRREEFASDPFVSLSDWMRRLGTALSSRKILLCLDEFERLYELVDSKNTRVPLNWLRGLIQDRDRWIVLLSVSQQLDDLPPYMHDYLINTQSVSVGYLSNSEARDLLLKPIPEFPDIYQADLADGVLHLTRGHPYLTQLMGTVIVDRLNASSRKCADSSDLEPAIEAAFERGGEFFREFWANQLSLNEDQRVVERLVSGALAANFVTGSDMATIKRLVTSGVLEPYAGSFRFQVPLIGLYVKSRIERRHVDQ